MTLIGANMDLTRDFTATMYIVNDGATALHTHESGRLLPPCGHIEGIEAPHDAAQRETVEETGLIPEIITDLEPLTIDHGYMLPRPRHQMVFDIEKDGYAPTHQHIETIYYGRVFSREINPLSSDEVPAEEWQWYTADDLRAGDFPQNVVRFGCEAIDVVANSPH